MIDRQMKPCYFRHVFPSVSQKPNDPEGGTKIFPCIRHHRTRILTIFFFVLQKREVLVNPRYEPFVMLQSFISFSQDANDSFNASVICFFEPGVSGGI